MLYQTYQFHDDLVAPQREAARYALAMLTAQPWSFATKAAQHAAALCEMITRFELSHVRPDFGIKKVQVGDRKVPVREEIALDLPFGNLLHFVREPAALPKSQENPPKALLVAPMSGHYATLLRGTVRAMLRDHDVYITDWTDAREVPLIAGKFALDDYIEYLITFIRAIGPDVHVVAVCQPGPAALAAAAIMAEDGDPLIPASLTLMGSPIDTRKSPTTPNELATSQPLDWFESNVIYNVPFGYPGYMRRVYPGFMQLTGFMTMNLERHFEAHVKLYDNLVKGDGDSVDQHRKFYDEYLSVMDMTAEFYLDTIKRVFQDHDLPDGNFSWRGRKVDPAAITKTALMTVEGENDDISGIGQTQAAHDLCPNIPDDMQLDYIQPNVGHYGVFNGSRWRNEIQPKVAKFMAMAGREAAKRAPMKAAAE